MNLMMTVIGFCIRKCSKCAIADLLGYCLIASRSKVDIAWNLADASYVENVESVFLSNRFCNRIKDLLVSGYISSNIRNSCRINPNHYIRMVLHYRGNLFHRRPISYGVIQPAAKGRYPLLHIMKPSIVEDYAVMRYRQLRSDGIKQGSGTSVIVALRDYLTKIIRGEVSATKRNSANIPSIMPIINFTAEVMSGVTRISKTDGIAKLYGGGIGIAIRREQKRKQNRILHKSPIAVKMYRIFYKSHLGNQEFCELNNLCFSTY